MKEFKLIEKITDGVLISLMLWIVLAALANLIGWLGFGESILGQTIMGALELVGLFLFIKAVWKYFKKVKTTKK